MLRYIIVNRIMSSSLQKTKTPIPDIPSTPIKSYLANKNAFEDLRVKPKPSFFNKFRTSFKRVFTRKRKSPELMPLLPAKTKRTPLYRRIGKRIRSTGKKFKTTLKKLPTYLKNIPTRYRAYRERRRTAKARKNMPTMNENRPDEYRYKIDPNDDDYA
jgi:hypothetical protein